MMKLLLPLVGLSLLGCGDDEASMLKPSEFSAELAVEASNAVPNRICALVGADGNKVEMKIRGGSAYISSDMGGHWEIVEPSAWSAANVSSRFDMGLGGESTHLWKTAGGDMSARVSWCDECPPDGTDSTIVVTDHSVSSNFNGVCRPIETEEQKVDSRT